MIETHIFTTGDINEVKAWLDENANDIFDSIEISSTVINCTIGLTTAVTIGFDSKQTCVLRLDNNVNKTLEGYSQSHFNKAYKTDVGIWLFSIGNSYTVSVCVTKNGELYGCSGYTGGAGTRYVGIMDAPSFTDVPTPTEFAITSLSPAPYTSAAVSENMFLAIWTQLPQPGRLPKPQIVEINDANYVYDGFMCLKE